MSEISFGAFTTPIGVTHALHAYTYTVWVSGSYDPPGQLVPPLAVPIVSVASGPPTLLSEGGVNTGPILYFEISVIASSRSAGVKSIRSSLNTPLRLYAGGLLGIGCVAEYHSPGTVPFSTGFSGIGHTGFPVTRSSTYRNPCLLGCATAFTARPSTLMSARIGADEMSMSHSGWCTSWKCHLRWPVFRSTLTSDSPNRLSPGRSPP